MATKVKASDSEAERGKKVLTGWSAPINQRLPIQKWRAGLVLVGTLISHKRLPDAPDGKKKGGVIFVFELAENERVCYGAPTILWEAMEPLLFGTEMRIECLGQIIPSKRGQHAWGFDVRIRD